MVSMFVRCVWLTLSILLHYVMTPKEDPSASKSKGLSDSASDSTRSSHAAASVVPSLKSFHQLFMPHKARQCKADESGGPLSTKHIETCQNSFRPFGFAIHLNWLSMGWLL